MVEVDEGVVDDGCGGGGGGGGPDMGGNGATCIGMIPVVGCVSKP